MIIKKIAIGNSYEAFIEERFQNKTNIIFSNDNNRGKTIVMQSIAHSIGNESIFPSTFDSKDYYFYSSIDFDGLNFEFLRKRNSILVLHNENLNVFSSISEFKYFFNKKIYELPKIESKGELRTVDLTLFYELFFLGQDKRNTSNLIVKGRNNKEDFKKMIFSLKGLETTSFNKYDIEELKNKRKSIQLKINSEKKKITILKKNPEIASFISSTANDIEFKKTSKQLNELHKNIADLRKHRYREENRKIKLETLITELNSLNRSLNEGKVKCSECGSNKIIFTNEDFDFDISNNTVKKNILKSINENIISKKEIIQEFNDEIIKYQNQINKLLEVSTPDSKNYILFENEIITSKDIDTIVYKLQKEVDEITNKLENNETVISSNKDKQNDILKRIIEKMIVLYSKVDKEGKLVFDDLFTKNSKTYSGSEGQEYYFCKILSLNEILSHNFPLIIDSFREGELSTKKETYMIEEYIKLNKQVILTSTLKDEEYDSDKYYNIKGINVIDYSKVEDSKLLQVSFLQEFTELLDKFGI